jgi:hypothetical protein
MALPTYLELVNDVLARLREPTVSTVNENTYSAMIGTYVNDTKRQVNDAYDWDALNAYVDVTCVPGQWTGYSITGAGQRFRVNDVINTTRLWPLTPIDKPSLDRFMYMMKDPVHNPPVNFNLGIVDSNGDMMCSFWPIPTAADNIKFSLVIPETPFANDSDTTKMPREPIVLGAYARALVERGEDGGLNSSEAFVLFKASLADYIATEAARSPENDVWDLV